MTRIEPVIGSFENGGSIETADVDTFETEPQSNYVEPNKLSFPLASPASRYLARLLDTLVAFGIFLGCLYFSQETRLERSYSDILVVPLPILYIIFCDAFPNGQSLGKKVFGIAVIDNKDEQHCSLFQSFLRNILVSVLGVFEALFILNKRRRRLGDFFAGTVVVKIR